MSHLALNVEIEKLRFGKGGPGKVRGGELFILVR